MVGLGKVEVLARLVGRLAPRFTDTNADVAAPFRYVFSVLHDDVHCAFVDTTLA